MLRTTDGAIKVDLNLFHTPVDYWALALASQSIGPNDFLLDPPTESVRNSVRVVSSYQYVRGEIEGVLLTYLFEPRPDWYFGVSAYLSPPYDQEPLAELAALVASVSFQ